MANTNIIDTMWGSIMTSCIVLFDFQDPSAVDDKQELFWWGLVEQIAKFLMFYTF